MKELLKDPHGVERAKRKMWHVIDEGGDIDGLCHALCFSGCSVTQTVVARSRHPSDHVKAPLRCLTNSAKMGREATRHVLAVLRDVGGVDLNLPVDGGKSLAWHAAVRGGVEGFQALRDLYVVERGKEREREREQGGGGREGGEPGRESGIGGRENETEAVALVVKPLTGVKNANPSRYDGPPPTPPPPPIVVSHTHRFLEELYGRRIDAHDRRNGGRDRPVPLLRGVGGHGARGGGTPTSDTTFNGANDRGLSLLCVRSGHACAFHDDRWREGGVNHRPAPQSPRSPMATRVEGKAVEGAKDNSGLRENSQERAARKLGIVLPETPRDQIELLPGTVWPEMMRRLEDASDEREADVERTALLLCALINDNQHRAIGTVFEAFASMDHRHGAGDRVGRRVEKEEEKETKGAVGTGEGPAGLAGPAGDNERQSVASLHLKASHYQDKHCYLDLNDPNPALAALQLRFCEPHGRNLMALAASTGHVDCIRALHRQGGDVNMGSEQDRTAAMWAARSDKTECLVALHELGVDMSSSCDAEMNAPAYWAAKCGNVAALHTLKHECGVDLKASVNYGNVVDDTTVLYWLAWFGQGAAICEIADLESDLELDAPCCDDDWTPLQIARVKGHEECAGMIEARLCGGAGGGGTRSTWVCPGMAPGGAAEREQTEAAAKDTAAVAVAVAVTAAAGRRTLSVPLSEDSDDNSQKRESSAPAEP
jgi:hypothetical protein